MKTENTKNINLLYSIFHLIIYKYFI
jgi:hypothetical protein